MRNVKTYNDACILVRLNADHLKDLSAALGETLNRYEVVSEPVANEPHVSIAYCEGCSTFDAIRDVVSEIEKVGDGSPVRCGRFTVLTGVTTSYDYLAIELEPHKGLNQARGIAGRRLTTRGFRGGFKSHVSLLRFAKGSLSAGQKVRLVRELNASLHAARALGRAPAWKLESIEVSSSAREIFYSRRLLAA